MCTCTWLQISVKFNEFNINWCQSTVFRQIRIKTDCFENCLHMNGTFLKCFAKWKIRNFWIKFFLVKNKTYKNQIEGKKMKLNKKSKKFDHSSPNKIKKIYRKCTTSNYLITKKRGDINKHWIHNNQVNSAAWLFVVIKKTSNLHDLSKWWKSRHKPIGSRLHRRESQCIYYLLYGMVDNFPVDG